MVGLRMAGYPPVMVSVSVGVPRFLFSLLTYSLTLNTVQLTTLFRFPGICFWQ